MAGAYSGCNLERLKVLTASPFKIAVVLSQDMSKCHVRGRLTWDRAREPAERPVAPGQTLWRDVSYVEDHGPSA